MCASEAQQPIGSARGLGIDFSTRSCKLRGVGRSGKQYSLSFGDVIIFEAFSLQGWVKGLQRPHGCEVVPPAVLPVCSLSPGCGCSAAVQWLSQIALVPRVPFSFSIWGSQKSVSPSLPCRGPGI